MIPADLNTTPLFQGRRIVIIGDLMLDRFIYGQVRRLSPEAPVPVLLKQREALMPGGAGNVARNIAALGGVAVLIAARGSDPAGRSLSAALASIRGIEDRSVEFDGMATTEKLRFYAQQHLLRVDSEIPFSVPAAALLPAMEAALEGAGAVILSDYAKGVLSPELIAGAAAACRRRGLPLIVDPKARDLARYNGATLLTPNRGEAETSAGVEIHDDAAAELAAQVILRNLPATPAVIITRGGQGLTLLERSPAGFAPALHLRAQAREVFDVSGAGDTLVAVLALGLAAQLELRPALHIANLAAGLVVGKPGTATVAPADLNRALRSELVDSLDEKIVALEPLLHQAAAWRQAGERVGFTNGCFDLLHPGHITLLRQARAACDRLVVGLNTDASARRRKGRAHPVQDEIARAIVLASLSMVDRVVLFAEDTPLELIRALRPDVLVKGDNYRLDQITGAREVEAYGGRVLRVPLPSAAAHPAASASSSTD